ncbi:MAG TPA: hypothetical protein VFQ35_03875 [Polyangiaceae bacterium]|nr:hypothetical protein [Polyangiaceae bacterium]
MRLRFGIGLALAGAASALFWALPHGGALAWTATLGLLASGAFAIFEARKGWCAVRALGIKTPV